MSNIPYLRRKVSLYKKILMDCEVNLNDRYEVLKDLITQSNDLSYEIYQFLLKKPEFIDLDFLSKESEIPPEVLSYIFREKPKIAFFPITNGKNSDIAKAVVIKLPVKTPKSSFQDISGLSRVKHYIQQLKDTDFEDFFVIFDKDFSGESYQLAVVMALLGDEKTLQRYAFTGVVNIKGDIVQVDHIQEKEKVCKERGLILVKPDTFQNINQLLNFLNKKSIDIPFVILNKDLSTVEKSLEELYETIGHQTSNYLKLYNLSKEDLYLQTVSLPPDREVWRKYLEDFSMKVKKIYSSIPDKSITLHIVNSIATFGFLAGAILGSKHEFVVYHFADKYKPVINLTGENIRNNKKVKKDILNNSKFLELDIRITKPSKEANLIIYTASHNPVADVVNFTKSTEYIYIKDKLYNGKIPTDIDWAEYVSEIYSVMNVLKESYYISSYNLFISIPSAMAFALGMAVGHFMDINVYNYYRDTEEKYYLVGNPKDFEAVI